METPTHTRKSVAQEPSTKTKLYAEVTNQQTKNVEPTIQGTELHKNNKEFPTIAQKCTDAALKDAIIPTVIKIINVIPTLRDR